MSKNIEFDKLELEKAITKLKNDNVSIVGVLTQINAELNKIEKNEWDSPEKNKLNEGFIPYMINSKQTIENELNNCINALEFVIESYKEVDEELEKQTDILES